MNTYAWELYRGDKNRVVEDIRTSFHYTIIATGEFYLIHQTLSYHSLHSSSLGPLDFFFFFFRLLSFGFSWIWRGRWARSGRTLERDGVCEPLHGPRLGFIWMIWITECNGDRMNGTLDIFILDHLETLEDLNFDRKESEFKMMDATRVELPVDQ